MSKQDITTGLQNEDKHMLIKKTCPMCKRELAIKMNDEDYQKYQDKNNGLIQERLPNIGTVEREFLISGYCFSCQAQIFGTTYKPNREIWVEF